MGPPPPSQISIPSLYKPNKTLEKSKQKTKRKAIELAQATRGVRRPPPPPPPPPMSNPTAPPAAAPLLKHKSWSPDVYRDEAWVLRRKGINDRRKRRSKSVTDEDLDELKACIELGFGFDSPEVDPGLSDTLPALGLYYAVNKTYSDSVSKSSSLFSSTASECESPSSVGSPSTILGLGDNPQTVKTRLRQWAQVVACSVRQSSSG
ncbi:uncharacterized protein LOC131304193 [Rhododendron vialii]|uniref:uncharacterized protein LOC131304193 n=1 Tax=Rhododendron vialii TaxID=182163 RepID=UPI00265D799D|nr:uncharacterized protein LOC131304193 [Rhododendron vialii]